MATAAATDLRLRVQDVTGQKMASVSDISPDSTVGELIDGVLAKMRLPDTDSEGRPLSYQARLEREGRHLHASEIVGDAMQTDDEVVLLPDVDAGGPPAA